MRTRKVNPRTGEVHCARCKQWKDPKLFAKDKHRPSGYCSYCKNCTKIRDEERLSRPPVPREIGPARVRADGALWCPSCKNYLGPKAFYRHATNPSGKQSYCIDCQKERSKNYTRPGKAARSEEAVIFDAKVTSIPHSTNGIGYAPAKSEQATTNKPIFIETKLYDFNLANIALLDKSRMPHQLQIVLGLQEMDASGYMRSQTYIVPEDEARTVYAAIQIARGIDPEVHAELDQLRAEVERLKSERDAAFELAGQYETKLNRFRDMLEGK